MKGMSRRKLLSSAAASAGVFSLGNISCCSAPEPEKPALKRKNGYIDLPDKPGFGMELAPDLEKKFPYIPGYYRKPNPRML